jgi:hypothetical protein
LPWRSASVWVWHSLPPLSGDFSRMLMRIRTLAE